MVLVVTDHGELVEGFGEEFERLWELFAPEAGHSQKWETSAGRRGCDD